MSNNPYVLAARRDLPYLLNILNVSSSKTREMHAPCPICGDKTCLQFGPDKKITGDWYWHCNRGCGGGDVVAALCKLHYGGPEGWRQAYDHLKRDFGGRVSQSPHERQKNALVNRHGYVNGVVPTLQGIAALSGSGPVPRIDRVDPILDMERAEKFIAEHHNYLMDHFDLVTKWGRGLSKEVCEKYRIGFIEFGSVQFQPWKRKMDIPAAWVLPITDADGVLKAVKVHFEERPAAWQGCPKLLWMPFGTSPAYDEKTDSKPIHAYTTMWPHPDTLTPQIDSDFSLEASYWIERMPEELNPEWYTALESHKLKFAWEKGKTTEDLNPGELWDVMQLAFNDIKQKIFKAVLKKQNKKSGENSQTIVTNGKISVEVDWSQYIFICPGELKALACESAGMMATAGTQGEGWIPGAEYISKLAGQKICLLGDEDPAKRNVSKKDQQILKIHCPGKDWIGKWSEALASHGASRVMVKYGGQRGKNE